MDNTQIKSNINHFQFFASLLLVNVVVARSLQESAQLQMLVGLCLFIGVFFSIKIFLKLKNNANHKAEVMLYQYFGISLFVSLVFLFFSFYYNRTPISIFLAVCALILMIYRFILDFKLSKIDNILKK